MLHGRILTKADDDATKTIVLKYERKTSRHFLNLIIKCILSPLENLIKDFHPTTKLAMSMSKFSY